jgi:hypothetical protein
MKTQKQLVKSAKQYAENNIAPRFHDKLLAGLTKLKLSELLKRKNPYLFKAKAIQTAPDLVKRLLDAYISSQEETIFGDFLEGLAIHICGHAFGGKKSAAEGIDLEFERDKRRYIVSIKSGPNWGNSQQIKRMLSNFAQAKKIAGSKVLIEAINGCCYGQESKPHKGTYLKLCGQPFWALISGRDSFYLDIIEPLGFEAKRHTEEFDEKYAAVINTFTKTFIESYCSLSGEIEWEKLVAFNSSDNSKL